MYFKIQHTVIIKVICMQTVRKFGVVITLIPLLLYRPIASQSGGNKRSMHTGQVYYVEHSLNVQEWYNEVKQVYAMIGNMSRIIKFC